MNYNAAGDLSTISYSDSTPGVTNTYDRLGRQATITRNGITATLAYTLAGALTSESYSGGILAGLAVTNGYDQFLRRTNLVLQQSSNPTIQQSFVFDAASRLQRVTDYTTASPYSAGYTYLANSPLVGQIGFTNNGSWRMTTSKQFDFLNHLTSISSVGSGSSSLPSFSYVYNSANQRTRRVEADGSDWRFNYDPLGQVTSGRKYWPDFTPVAGQQFEYAFDDIGNRLWTRAGGDENGLNLRYAGYGANSLNQYTNRDVPGAVDVMGIELATNTVKVNEQTAYRKGEYFRKEITVTNVSNPVWQSITVTATNETTVSGNVFVPKTKEQFSYDADGNLTSDGRWNYGWDAENRLITMAANTAVGPQISLKFEYDSKSRRIRKQVWPNTAWSGTSTNDVRFLYDGWKIIATLNPQLSTLNSFLWGLDLSGLLQGAGGVGGLLAVNDAVNGIHFSAFDGNGNVVALVKASGGTTSACYEYGPFGEITRSTGLMANGNPIRFSTQYQDDQTDLLYCGRGYYSAGAGRSLNKELAEGAEWERYRGFADQGPVTRPTVPHPNYPGIPTKPPPTGGPTLPLPGVPVTPYPPSPPRIPTSPVPTGPPPPVPGTPPGGVAKPIPGLPGAVMACAKAGAGVLDDISSWLQIKKCTEALKSAGSGEKCCVIIYCYHCGCASGTMYYDYIGTYLDNKPCAKSKEQIDDRDVLLPTCPKSYQKRDIAYQPMSNP